MWCLFVVYKEISLEPKTGLCIEKALNHVHSAPQIAGLLVATINRLVLLLAVFVPKLACLHTF